MISRQYSGDYSGGLAEERASFTHILPVSWPYFIRALATKSRENKMAVTTENESEKCSTYVYTQPIHLSLFSNFKFVN